MMKLKCGRVLKNVSTPSQTLSVLPNSRAGSVISKRKEGEGGSPAPEITLALTLSPLKCWHDISAYFWESSQKVKWAGNYRIVLRKCHHLFEHFSAALVPFLVDPHHFDMRDMLRMSPLLFAPVSTVRLFKMTVSGSWKGHFHKYTDHRWPPRCCIFSAAS